MDEWRPRVRRETELMSLPLGAEEGFVLSRLDGSTPLSQLGAVTGLPAERVLAILARLVTLGAVDPEGPPPSRLPGPAGAVTPAPPEPMAASAVARTRPAPDVEQRPDGDGDRDLDEDAEDDEAPAVEAVRLSARALFGQHLRHLEEGERVSRAEQAQDPELSAFCFDPLPSVARALLSNPRFTPTHARMFARFHHSPPGLELLSSRVALARDPVVERSLLRNPQLPQGAARRMLISRRLLKLWLLHVDREVPELTRKLSKEVLRSRFGAVQAEERVDLILRTDGRVLGTLSGLTVDGRTTALLCQRSYHSPLLILNLCRWSACPAQLLVHLWHQPSVRNQLQLRQALLRHPNLPSELKREGAERS